MNTIIPSGISIDSQAERLKDVTSRLEAARKSRAKDKIVALLAGVTPFAMLFTGTVGSYLLSLSEPLKACGLAAGTLFSFAVCAKATDCYAEWLEATDRGIDMPERSIKNGSIFGPVSLVKRAYKRVPLLNWLSSHRKANLEYSLQQIAKYHGTDLHSLLPTVDQKIAQAQLTGHDQRSINLLLAQRRTLEISLKILGVF